MKILHVVGARPNFMKMAPIIHEMAKYPDQFEQRLVHTGQHYDGRMSQVFFDQLGLPPPDVNLEVGSGSHAQQTALIMQRFEPVLKEFQPDWLLVPGDVNSTLACALVASKLGIKVAHIESGLRSFDRTMPEEINRVLTDHVADLLFTTEESGNRNLIKEGIDRARIHFVGNTMIDTLVRLLPLAEKRADQLCKLYGDEPYLLVTLHRPSNVDNSSNLDRIMESLQRISRYIKVIFPIHPRTRQHLNGAFVRTNTFILEEPLNYLDFLALQSRAQAVLTDSGGIQEETTFLGVQCLTLRENTERPVTITHGTNRLIKCSEIEDRVREVNQSTRPQRPEIPLWDSRTAPRIVKRLRLSW